MKQTRRDWLAWMLGGVATGVMYTPLAAQVRLRLGTASPAPSGDFVDHPRLMTSTMISEITAKRTGGDSAYGTYKADADYLISTYGMGVATTTLTVGIDADDMSFTVADASVFTGSGTRHFIIGHESITGTISGNTITVVARGTDTGANPFYDSTTTTAAAHSNGERVYQYTWGDLPSEMAGICHVAGETGYALAGRHMTAVLAATCEAKSGTYYAFYHQDRVRALGVGFVRSVDYFWDEFSAEEQALHSDLCVRIAEAHITDNVNVHGAKWQYAFDNSSRLSSKQNAMAVNICCGQLYVSAAAAIVAHGHEAAAAQHYIDVVDLIDTYLMTSMESGPFYGAMSPEGFSYGHESWEFAFRIFTILEAATGDTSRNTLRDAFAQRFIYLLTGVTFPESTNTTGTTTYSGSDGAYTATFASTTGFAVGQVVLDGISFESTIVDIAGTTVTFADPLNATITNRTIYRGVSRIMQLGDSLQDRDRYTQTIDAISTDAMTAMNFLRSTNATWAGYARYWIDTYGAALSRGSYHSRVLYDDTTVSPGNYTAALDPYFSTGISGTCGLMTSRSSWATDATFVTLYLGMESWDHNHCAYGSYGIWRKGVELSAEIGGYGGSVYPGDASSPYDTLKSYWIGPECHNTLEMREIPGQASGGPTLEPGLAIHERDENTAAYAYARGNLIGPYQSVGAATWVSAGGYPADTPDVFVRDFVHVRPDIIVFHDRLGYTGSATTSPTTWFLQFPKQPTVTGTTVKRASLAFGGQELIQDILLPASATVTGVDAVAESEGRSRPHAGSGGRLSRPWYRLEVVSGASVTTESSLQVIQVGDSGFTPATPTQHVDTTGNAHIVQVGSDACLAFVNGATPTLPITFPISGTPTVRRIFGLAVSTAYHITNSGGTVTIAAATGSGDTTSTTEGTAAF